MTWKVRRHAGRRPLPARAAFAAVVFALVLLASPARAGWLSPWEYRQRVTADNSSNPAALSLSQVELVLTAKTFDFSRAKPDGADLRFTAEDGVTPLAYWIERYDPAAHFALVSVCVPLLPAGAARSFYLYSGNPEAAAASDWRATFRSGPTDPVVSPLGLPGAHNAFPSAVRLANGEIIAAFRAGSEHLGADGQIRLAHSSDDGRTWTAESLFDDPGVDDRVNLGLTLLSDGTLVLPFYQHDGYQPIASFLLRSADGGHSWSPPLPVESPFSGWMACYGRIIEEKDGRLLMPVYGTDVGQDTTHCALLESPDRGTTWTRKSVIASGGRSFNETSVVALEGDTLLAAIRAGSVDAHLYRALSLDGGATWSKPEPLFDGASPELLRLADGTLVLLAAHREGIIFGLRSVCSADGGRTWTGGELIGPASGDLGYPSTVATASRDTCLTVYYDNGSLTASRYGQDFVTSNPNGLNWYEGFELGGASKWVFLQGSSVLFTADLERSGARSMKVNDLTGDSPTSAVRSVSDFPLAEGRISFWIDPEALPHGAEFGLLSDLQPAGDPLSDPRFWFRVAPGGALQSKVEGAWADLGASLRDSAWTKIALHFDALANEADVYVDGTLAGTAKAFAPGGRILYLGFASGSVEGVGDNFSIDDIVMGQTMRFRPGVSLEPATERDRKEAQGRSAPSKKRKSGA